MLIAWVFLALLNRLKIKQTIQNTLMAGCFLIFLLPACYETGQYLFDSGNYYNQLEATLPKKDFQPNQQILANEDAYAVRIRYLYAQNDWQCQMETAQFKEQVWLILQKSTKLPKAIPIEEYQLLNENEVVWVYKRR